MLDSSFNYSARLEQLRSRLAEQELDGFLVTDETNVRYLSGFSGDSSALFVTPLDVWIISDRRYEIQIAEECPSLKTRIRGPERRMHDQVGELIDQLGLRRVGLEEHAVSWGMLRAITAAVKQCQLVATSGWIVTQRAIKDPLELQQIRRAVRCAERAFGLFRAALRPGMTELEGARVLAEGVADFGGEGMGFPSIIASGPHAALPHYRPRNEPIVEGQTLLVDWGAKVDGYTSDLTRTLFLGTPEPRFIECYQIVLEAFWAGVRAIGPGVPLRDVDAASRGVITKAGYGEAFGHGLGHGIGLQVHESPRLAAIESGKLAVGMVITVEPGIYLPGEFGVRIEDDILVTEKGAEVLSSLPKGLDENIVIM